jgi:asparagine synthase (glutamine-hydrolysing)
MGMRPLYYGENKTFAALASERKALWKIGVENSDSFPPGQVSLIDEHGFEFAPSRTILHVRQRHIDMHAASEKLLTLLQRSVEERLSDLKQCAVAFSGGLDSSIIAFLAKNFGVDVYLIHVSLENQVETEHAEKVADELRLPIHSYVYTEQDVHTTVAKVLQLIEKPDPVQTSIGIPIYWAAERARQMGFEAMLAGQGADELFAGYRRYVDDYIRFGSKKAQKNVLKDVAELYKNNLERDAKICNFHNIELRLPFATFRIAKFASELPLNLKIEPKTETVRKLVLRQLAKNLGLQKEVVDRPKKAVQYTTGVNKALKKIARKKGLSVNEYVKDAFQRTFKEIISHG